MQPLADTFPVHQLPPYMLGGIAQAVVQHRSAGHDVIDLSQINPSTGVPPAALDRLVQASLREHNHQYSSSQGISSLRRAIQTKYLEDHAVELSDTTQLVVTMGVKEGIGHLLLALCHPGDSVIVPTPSYPVHGAAISIARANALTIPLWTEQEEPQPEICVSNSTFVDRLSKLVQASWPRPKAMLINFPHNPTTTTASVLFFEALVGFARANGIWLIHDFAADDLGFDGYRPPSLLQVPGGIEVAVECCSLSKSLGLAGWRIGFMAGNEHLISALKKIKSYLDFGIFQPLQIAAVTALEERKSFGEHVCGVYQSRRDVLYDGLSEIGWKVELPRAGVFLWASLPESLSVVGSMNFAKCLLEDSHVAVCPGEGFDVASKSFVRFSLGEPERRIRKALQNIEVLGKRLSKNA